MGQEKNLHINTGLILIDLSKVVPAEQVHYAFVSVLGRMYCKVIPTEGYCSTNRRFGVSKTEAKAETDEK